MIKYAYASVDHVIVDTALIADCQQLLTLPHLLPVLQLKRSHDNNKEQPDLMLIKCAVRGHPIK